MSDILQRQGQQLGRLVDDLLDVARVTRGTIELKREPLLLEVVLESAVETVQPLIAAKHQAIRVQPAALPARVAGDPVRLSQVFANLLANASKYSPEGAAIEVFLEVVGEQAIARVRDHGIGIDAETLPHIFELFMQADRSLDRTQGGLGIGLTIVRSLVEMHGGRVEARSEGAGRGSEFVVSLPLLAMKGAAPAASDPAESSPPPTRRILLVDDNVDLARSLGLLLAMAGHEVRTAHEGEAALAMLESFAAEIVLLDIGLPKVDGYALAQSIRERFAQSPRRLIALTGYGRTEDRSLALASGFDEHLVKPVDPEALLALIAREFPSALAASPQPP